MYVARFLTPEGQYILNCIDRWGRKIAQLVVDDPERWTEYERMAEEALDEHDPGVKLVVVRGGAAREPT